MRMSGVLLDVGHYLLRLLTMAAQDVREESIDRVERSRHGAQKIDDQHHAKPIALVLDLMLSTVVEENAFALFPDVNLVIDAHRRGIVLRHNQSEMVAQVAEIKAAVRRNRFAGVQNGKESLVQVRNRGQQSRSERTFLLVGFGCANQRA